MMIHLVVVLFTSFIIYIAKPGSSLFSWHPTLMSVAFCLFMYEGLLVFSPHSSLISPQNRIARITWHWILLTVALSAATVGTAVIYYNKHINNKPHFTTWHGYIGIISLAYFALQALGGIVAKYPRLLLPSFKIVDVRLYHVASGLVAICLVNMTLYLSMYSNWFVRNVVGYMWYVCTSALALMTVSVIQQIIATHVPRLMNRLRRHIQVEI